MAQDVSRCVRGPGRMGAEVCIAVKAADGLQLVAALDLGDDRAVAEAADVAVDFTHPDAVMDNIAWCIQHGIHAVVGTTGFTNEKYDVIRRQLGEYPAVGVLIAANFSIGAVLMMYFAEQAAKFYESVEIVELHHAGKADAPSGTAATTAAGGGRPRPRVSAAARRDGPGTAWCAGRFNRWHPRARRAASGTGRTPGGAVRRRRRVADHPPRLAGSGLVHAGRHRWGASRELAARADGGHRRHLGLVSSHAC